MLLIRPYEHDDWQPLWEILRPVFRAGTTYVYSPHISESEAKDVWIDKPLATFVAEDNGTILGTYYIKPNQPGLGAHVCNCGYIVSTEARGRGIASKLCEHSQEEALSRGFLSMQFNLVVSTNEMAVRLWKKHGFDMIGTIPSAFFHSEHGYVDAHIMHKILKAEKTDAGSS